MKQLNPDVEEVLVTSEQIVTRAEELGQIITKKYKDKNPILIGLLKGAVPFMAELIKHIYCPMEIDFIDVKSYEGTVSSGIVKIVRDVTCNVNNRDIIFVEDIIDTGLTLDCVCKEFQKRGPSSMEIVTLLDKEEGRNVDNILKPKYVGFSIPKKFVIGFGLDYNEQYRNLPYIGVLKPSVYE